MSTLRPQVSSSAPALEIDARRLQEKSQRSCPAEWRGLIWRKEPKRCGRPARRELQGPCRGVAQRSFPALGGRSRKVWPAPTQATRRADAVADPMNRPANQTMDHYLSVKTRL